MSNDDQIFYIVFCRVSRSTRLFLRYLQDFTYTFTIGKRTTPLNRSGNVWFELSQTLFSFRLHQITLTNWTSRRFLDTES